MWDYIKMWNTWGRVGIIVGIIGGLAGALAAIIAAPIPGTIMTVVMFSIFYFTFKSVLGPEVEARKILENGIDAEATILEVKETGWTVNDIYYIVNFVVEVRPKDQPPYKAKIRGMISRLTMPQFQPGAIVPVKYDPKNPQKVALVETTEAASSGESGGMSGSQLESLKKMLEEKEKAYQAIRETGVEAEAEIVRSWDMGVKVNGDNPLMGFALEVKPEGKPAFMAETQGVIQLTSVAKYQPGKKIVVKFDPKDQSKVSLFHS